LDPLKKKLPSGFELSTSSQKSESMRNWLVFKSGKPMLHHVFKIVFTRLPAASNDVKYTIN